MELELKVINQFNVINHDMRILADTLNKIKINTLTFRRNNITIRYSSLHVVFYINNNTRTLDINGYKNNEDILFLQEHSNEIYQLTIKNEDGLVRVFEKHHIDTLGGIDFSNNGLVIEFYKSTIFDMLYHTELLIHASRNPALKESINLLDKIDTKPSSILVDDEVVEIYDYLSRDIDLITIHLELIKHIREISTRYPMNLKSIEVVKTGYIIKIYSNVKELRYEECINASIKSDDNS